MFTKIVLVTGGSGFIGSHVVINLVQTFPKYVIINLDKLDYMANEENLKSVEACPNYRFIKGDITDIALMERIFAEERINYVIHCAAKSHVENSFFNSVEFTHDNVLGTHILLNSAYTFGNIELFLHVSTDEVYGGKAGCLGIKYETTIRHPTNPYAATKAAAECIVMSYWESFKFPVIITRMSNVYGPHQYPEKVIPKFIELLRRRRQCFVHGTGEQSRNFLYVTDAVEALTLLMRQGKPGEIYNVGSEFEITMKDLAVYMAMKVVGVSEIQAQGFITYVADRPFNDLRYLMNSHKVKELGWQQKIPWEDGIQKTIDWHHNHPNRWPSLERILTPFSVTGGCRQHQPKLHLNGHSNAKPAVLDAEEPADEEKD